MTNLIDSLSSRVELANFLYKLAIRTREVSRREVDKDRASMALNSIYAGNLRKTIDRFNPSSALGSKNAPASLQKMLATRTFVPDKGDGIRVDLIFGPLHLVESGNDFGVITSATSKNMIGEVEGLLLLPSGKSPLEDIMVHTFGGIFHKFKMLVAGGKEPPPYIVEMGYGPVTRNGKPVNTRVWKIVHNLGSRKGQIAWYKDPRIEGQMYSKSDEMGVDKTTNEELDPYKEAIFPSAKEAAIVLNDLEKNIRLKTRNIPKFEDYIVYVQYSSVYAEGDSDTAKMYAAVDRLLDDADYSSQEEVA